MSRSKTKIIQIDLNKRVSELGVLLKDLTERPKEERAEIVRILTRPPKVNNWNALPYRDLDAWLGMAIVVEVSVLPEMELSEKERSNLEANLKNNKDRLAKRLFNGKKILLKGSDNWSYHPQHASR